MSTPIYRKAIRDSLVLAWGNKHLWILGLFAAVLGQMGLIDILSGVGYAGEGRIALFNWLSWPEALWNSLHGLSLSVSQWIWLILVAMIFLALFVALVYAAVTSQAAVIAASIRHAYGKYTDAHSAWHFGQNHFWRLFFINLIKKVLIMVLTTIVGIGAFMVIANPRGIDIALFLALFILSAIVGAVVSFVSIYAASYVVAENHKFSRAIREAWSMFVSHWLVSVETGLIVLLTNVVFMVVLCVSILAMIVPTFIIWFLTMILSGNLFWFFGIVFGSMCAMAIALIIMAIFSIFTTSVWCNLFVRMHNEGVVSKVSRWVGVKKV